LNDVIANLRLCKYKIDIFEALLFAKKQIKIIIENGKRVKFKRDYL